ncbi:nucleoside ABC transporter ATP-binding protein [Aliiruegeria haliotis]|uniref:Nucleoside ABC transporter ATP-binding protein n=1 Tax=Aliiruegeria haliotis TaxID=1280846 RepID=A0A2T0RTF1_9RHOB|nr:ABC transporter ATP-binding protein [Aliiruegeria haliotis]PRY24454.1 nucleoside ABC transporter ATP-binding protein [Aliiruegeria haliotis]
MTTSQPVLSLRGMTKRFGTVTAADAIDLDLSRGEVLALLGENGAGKTTLMNMLFGQYTPDSGSVHVWDESGTERLLPPGQPHAAIEARIGMVHQHFTLAENLSVVDNILLGTERLFHLNRNRRAARAKLEALMTHSGLHAPLDARIRDLSVGERQRVEILKALYRDVRILVLDEPTAVLTPQEADGLFVSMRSMVAQGLSVIFISHKLREVLSFSDRIAVLRHGAKVGEMATAEADTHSIIRMMIGEEHDAPERSPGKTGETALRLSGINVAPGRDTGGLLDVSLDLKAGEIVGIAGVSGNGQSALARVISGLVAPSSGSIETATASQTALTPRTALAQGIGRIPEDRHHDGIVAALSVAENLVIERLDDPEVSRAGFLKRSAMAKHAEDLSAAYDVRGPGIHARAALLSGGNIQKLILARVLETHPGVILANQPTRGLDFRAAAEVSRRLIAARDRGAGVILISEDLDEVLSLADRILVMHAGELTETASRDRSAIGQLMAGHAA